MSKDIAKLASAETAIEKFIHPTDTPLIVGIGSGSTILHAVRFYCFYQAKHLIVENGLTLGDLDEFPTLDITIDGADEIDQNLNLIKGGGACMTMEKVVAFNSKCLVIIVDESKYSNYLGEKYTKGIPVEVIPASRVPVTKHLEKLGYQPVLRVAVNKAVRDNGNFVLDLKFDPKQPRDWVEENQKIKMIPGVIETGLFIKMVSNVVVGKSDKTADVVPIPTPK
ncbi:Ribose-5-phosphate isomerase [Thelohanellus kitauei]|uniref:ribose-5-phosphate isomerase n=1 Tax=Thelohanellus kitauei TaxID=669202 RepID=A0A0C2IWR9_THEKT|nr:Ribose-5-phosphate isomerase [Thelohanellus kitauei]